MSVITNSFLLLISIILLWKGADYLVDSASVIAKKFGVSDLVIGLTVVSFGTSAPEFAVSINAAIKELPSISIANIVGSNIFNLGFILGTVAIIKPVKTGKTVVHRDSIFLIFSTLLLLFFIINSSDFLISRFEGFIFLSLLISYLFYLFYKKEELPIAENINTNDENIANHKLNDELNNKSNDKLNQKLDNKSNDQSNALINNNNDKKSNQNINNIRSKNKILNFYYLHKNYFLLLSGMLMIFLGGEFLVNSASVLASIIGLSEWVIGVTVVAAGTSAPEFVTALVAVLKDKSEISIGNLIGSDIFNILGVLGLASLIRPLSVENTAIFSLLMLIFMVVLVYFFMKSNFTVTRKHGIILVALGLARWLLDFLL